MSGQHFLHCANILYLICYGVKDVLLLRIIAVTAMAVIMPYYFLPDDASAELAEKIAVARSVDGDTAAKNAAAMKVVDENLASIGQPRWSPIRWNLVFAAVNVYWIIRILLERRPPRLSDDEKKIYDLTFSKCSPREMLLLLEHAEWREADHGQTIVHQGIVDEKLFLLHSGVASVHIDGKRVAKLREGDFISEMSFLTGGPTIAKVVTETPIRYLVWNDEKLEKLFARRMDLKSALNSVIGQNLIEKLTASQGRLPELTRITLN